MKKYILAHVDVNCRDRDCKSTPLHMAAKGNHIEVVETLLKHGADVRLQDVRPHLSLSLLNILHILNVFNLCALCRKKVRHLFTKPRTRTRFT